MVVEADLGVRSGLPVALARTATLAVSAVTILTAALAATAGTIVAFALRTTVFATAVFTTALAAAIATMLPTAVAATILTAALTIAGRALFALFRLSLGLRLDGFAAAEDRAEELLYGAHDTLGLGLRLLGYRARLLFRAGLTLTLRSTGGRAAFAGYSFATFTAFTGRTLVTLAGTVFLTGFAVGGLFLPVATTFALRLRLVFGARNGLLTGGGDTLTPGSV